MHTAVFLKPARQSANIWSSTIAKDPIHRLTDKPPIRFTSTACHQSRLPHNKKAEIHL